MRTNPQEIAEMSTFTKEILNGKLVHCQVLLMTYI